jgi:hypothetical protein
MLPHALRIISESPRNLDERNVLIATAIHFTLSVDIDRHPAAALRCLGMKRVLTVLASVVVLLFLLSLAYRLSSWGKRTTTLRVELSIF